MRTGITHNDLNKLVSILTKAREIDLKVMEDMIAKARRQIELEQ